MNRRDGSIGFKSMTDVGDAILICFPRERHDQHGTDANYFLKPFFSVCVLSPDAGSFDPASVG
ncbi:hypothetical protein Cflav_PD2046 [Pedosphaera parvula Ellin514]|uniref:Uncharacterized protein n=1 Tax=Pedosphaera parvula (strain Ellin514) TaxID=320771 RepID=B9XMF5_PEDPL|nr:hypothetical protein Cflav_PD2046 [Pedosphaera parvula Ellin514]